MLVRPASARDVPAMATIHVESWRDTYTGLLPAALIASMDADRRERQWHRMLETADRLAWVAETDGELAGLCSVGPSERDHGIGQVYTLYLPGRFWGRGIGSALWETAMRGLRDLGFEESELWVLDTNARARSFYEAKGWIEDGSKVDELFGHPVPHVRYRSP